MPDGLAAVERRDPEFVVFGELHGTQEAPQFVGEIVCALAGTGERVLLAIEHSASDNPTLQKAWSATGQEFGPMLLEAGWQGREDGVASEAMYSMMLRAHRLKEEGAAIEVVAFNGFSSEAQRERFAHLDGQGRSEAAEAETVALAASKGGFDRVLILVGSLHARKDRVKAGGASFEAMAKRLERFGETVSLRMRHAAGTSWNCVLRPDFDHSAGRAVGPEDIDCDIHPTGGDADLERSPYIDLTPFTAEQSGGSFDGFFWVGPVSGSPPAAPAGEPQ